jgi:hypothetical protein
MAVYPMETSWVQGWTQARRFRLAIDGVHSDLTGRTFALILRDKDGATVATPGSVSIVVPQTGDDIGAVDYTPTDATVLTAARSPMTAHFEEDLGGKKRYWPNLHRGEAMLWHVGRAGG